MTEYWNGVPVRYDLLPIGTRRNGEKLHTKMENLALPLYTTQETQIQQHKIMSIITKTLTTLVGRK